MTAARWAYLAVAYRPLLTRTRQTHGLAVWGDHGVYDGWLSLRPWPPAPPVCGGCVPGFWIEQAHPDQPSVVNHARSITYPFSSSSETAGNALPPACSSGKRPGGRRPGAVAPAAAVAGRQRRSSDQTVVLQRDSGAAGVFKPHCCRWTFATGVGRRPPSRPAALDSGAVRSWLLAWRRCGAAGRSRVARIPGALSRRGGQLSRAAGAKTGMLGTVM